MSASVEGALPVGVTLPDGFSAGAAGQLDHADGGDSEKVTRRRQAITRDFAKLFQSKDFLDNINLATGDRVRTLGRVKSATDALETAGLKVDRPREIG